MKSDVLCFTNAKLSAYTITTVYFPLIISRWSIYLVIVASFTKNIVVPTRKNNMLPNICFDIP